MLSVLALSASFLIGRPPLASHPPLRMLADPELSSPPIEAPEDITPDAVGWKKTPGGIKFRELSMGNGEAPLEDSVVSVHYTISFAASGESLGSSRGRWPLTFALGKDHVPLFEEVVKSMRVGSSVRMVIPPSMIPKEQSSNVPRDQAKDSLVAEVELVGIETGLSAVIPSLLRPGSRRTVIMRSLFALSFLPYFLPDDIKPDIYKMGDIEAIKQAQEVAMNSKWLGGAATSLDSLFN